MQIPTILVNDGTVLDVVFTEWECNKAQDNWSISAETQLPTEAASKATHLVFELPIGCFMVDWENMGPVSLSDIIKVGPAGTGDRALQIEECTIPRKMRQELIEEAREEVHT